MQCLNIPETVERSIEQRRNVVVVQGQQIEVDNVPERVPPDAGNSVGVEQQQLQRRQSLEDSGRQFRDSVPVQNQ